MRLLIIGILFWLVLSVVMWFWGLPALANLVTERTRAENAQVCKDQLSNQRLIPDPVTEAEAEHYCDCLNKVLYFERDDLYEMARTRQLPGRLQTALQAQGQICQPELERAIRPPSADQPIERRDGSLEYQF